MIDRRSNAYHERQKAAIIALFAKHGIDLPNMYLDRPSPNWSMAQFPLGWLDLVDRLMADLVKIPEWNRQVLQVKSKLAGLRFYIGPGNEKIFKRISQAEKESSHICEDCGQRGSICSSSSGWWIVLCPECELEECLASVPAKHRDETIEHIQSYIFKHSWRGAKRRLFNRILELKYRVRSSFRYNRLTTWWHNRKRHD